MTSLELAQRAAKILDSKKAEQVKVLCVGDVSSLADYFVIATGTSTTHTRALSDDVEHLLQEQEAVSPLHVEGYSSNSWVLLDYAHIVVHIFTGEAREFYDLDRLWQDAKTVEIDFTAE